VEQWSNGFCSSSEHCNYDYFPFLYDTMAERDVNNNENTHIHKRWSRGGTKGYYLIVTLNTKSTKLLLDAQKVG
jgi:hypothetical protein